MAGVVHTAVKVHRIYSCRTLSVAGLCPVPSSFPSTACLSDTVSSNSARPASPCRLVTLASASHPCHGRRLVVKPDDALLCHRSSSPPWLPRLRLRPLPHAPGVVSASAGVVGAVGAILGVLTCRRQSVALPAHKNYPSHAKAQERFAPYLHAIKSPHQCQCTNTTRRNLRKHHTPAQCT